jgi:hypothetical protein
VKVDRGFAVAAIVRIRLTSEITERAIFFFLAGSNEISRKRSLVCIPNIDLN